MQAILLISDCTEFRLTSTHLYNPQDASHPSDSEDVSHRTYIILSATKCRVYKNFYLQLQAPEDHNLLIHRLLMYRVLNLYIPSMKIFSAKKITMNL